MIKPLHGGVEFILTAPHCCIRNPIEMNGNSRRGRNMLERGTRNAEQGTQNKQQKETATRILERMHSACPSDTRKTSTTPNRCFNTWISS